MGEGTDAKRTRSRVFNCCVDAGSGSGGAHDGCWLEAVSISSGGGGGRAEGVAGFGGGAGAAGATTVLRPRWNFSWERL